MITGAPPSPSTTPATARRSNVNLFLGRRTAHRTRRCLGVRPGSAMPSSSSKVVLCPKTAPPYCAASATAVHRWCGGCPGGLPPAFVEQLAAAARRLMDSSRGAGGSVPSAPASSLTLRPTSPARQAPADAQLICSSRRPTGATPPPPARPPRLRHRLTSAACARRRRRRPDRTFPRHRPGAAPAPVVRAAGIGSVSTPGARLPRGHARRPASCNSWRAGGVYRLGGLHAARTRPVVRSRSWPRRGSSAPRLHRWACRRRQSPASPARPVTVAVNVACPTIPRSCRRGWPGTPDGIRPSRASRISPDRLLSSASSRAGDLQL